MERNWGSRRDFLSYAWTPGHRRKARKGVGCNPHLVKGSGVLHLTPKTQQWLEIYKKMESRDVLLVWAGSSR